MGYNDGLNLLEYARSSPCVLFDSFGTETTCDNWKWYRWIGFKRWELISDTGWTAWALMPAIAWSPIDWIDADIPLLKYWYSQRVKIYNAVCEAEKCRHCAKYRAPEYWNSIGTSSCWIEYKRFETSCGSKTTICVSTFPSLGGQTSPPSDPGQSRTTSCSDIITSDPQENMRPNITNRGCR